MQGGDTIRRVDLTGRKWPVPVIEVAKIMKKAQPGERVEVVIDDLQSLEDLRKWSSRTRNKIVSEERVGSTWRIVIEKGG